MGPSGFIAVLAGWITTEVGRQPYTVHGLLRVNSIVLTRAVNIPQPYEFEYERTPRFTQRFDRSLGPGKNYFQTSNGSLEP